jgi:hypothetical protein
MIVEPIHITEINGLPLRMFASPLYTQFRQADYPWHSADDLRAILRLPDDLRALFQQRMKAEWTEQVKTVATPTGLTMIAPHYMAEGMLKAMQYRRKILPTEDRRHIRAHYRVAVTSAMMKMLNHMSDTEKVIFALSAHQ